MSMTGYGWPATRSWRVGRHAAITDTLLAGLLLASSTIHLALGCLLDLDGHNVVAGLLLVAAIIMKADSPFLNNIVVFFPGVGAGWLLSTDQQLDLSLTPVLHISAACWGLSGFLAVWLMNLVPWFTLTGGLTLTVLAARLEGDTWTLLMGAYFFGGILAIRMWLASNTDNEPSEFSLWSLKLAEHRMETSAMTGDATLPGQWQVSGGGRRSPGPAGGPEVRRCPVEAGESIDGSRDLPLQNTPRPPTENFEAPIIIAVAPESDVASVRSAKSDTSGMSLASSDDFVVSTSIFGGGPVQMPEYLANMRLQTCIRARYCSQPTSSL